MFVSGSQDKTARLWDLRAAAAINIIPSPSPGNSISNNKVATLFVVLSS